MAQESMWEHAIIHFAILINFNPASPSLFQDAIIKAQAPKDTGYT
jgi:hypothetical protein